MAMASSNRTRLHPETVPSMPARRTPRSAARKAAGVRRAVASPSRSAAAKPSRARPAPAAKRRAKRAAAAKVAAKPVAPAKRVAKAPAKRVAAAKRVAKAPAKRVAAAKRIVPAKRVAKASVRLAAAAKRAAKGPAKRVAPAPTKRHAAPPRAAMVRDLERGSDAVLAAIRGLSAGAAERPLAPGKWSPRQVVLHLAYWDEWMLGVLPAAIARNRPPGPLDDARVQAASAAAVTAGAGLPWEEVRTLWATQRALLLGLLAAVPARPAERWTTAHALGATLAGYAAHDRHHAAQIRAARGTRAPAVPRPPTPPTPPTPAKPFTPAFAAQRQAASARDLLLFELQRARVAVHAALKGMGAGSALQPIAPGKWSPHEIVLHLVARDQARLGEFDAVLAGAAPSWALFGPADWPGVNEGHIAPLRALSWDEAVQRLTATRERLLAALLAVPPEPAEVWGAGHVFGAMLLGLPDHDRHHAQQIQQARITS